MHVLDGLCVKSVLDPLFLCSINYSYEPSKSSQHSFLIDVHEIYLVCRLCHEFFKIINISLFVMIMNTGALLFGFMHASFVHRFDCGVQ